MPDRKHYPDPPPLAKVVARMAVGEPYASAVLPAPPLSVIQVGGDAEEARIIAEAWERGRRAHGETCPGCLICM